MDENLNDTAATGRKPSGDRQEDTAASVATLNGREAAEDIDPEHVAAIDEGLAEIERGDFASDDDVAAAIRRFSA